jgi:hypothetical protein
MKRLEPWVLTLISGFAVYLFDKLGGNRIPWQEMNEKWVLRWLNYDIKVYRIAIFGIVFWGGLILIKKMRNRGASYYSKKEREIREFNKAEIGGVLWKWDVYFDYNSKPAISGLTPYCISHGNPPIKMVEDYFAFKCLACNKGMPKSGNGINCVQGIENYIQSTLEERWEKIK